MKNYELYQDNSGRLHLAILDDSGSCVYYLCDADKKFVLDTLADFCAGSDPNDDCWEGGESDPQTCYDEILACVEAHNGGAWELEALE